jgi:hypothetical protein
MPATAVYPPPTATRATAKVIAHTLENELVSISFDQHGSIVSIQDKRLGREYLGESLGANLFRLMVPCPEWDGRHIDSCTQPNVQFKPGDGVALRITFPSLLLADEPVAVSAQVNIRLDGEHIVMSLHIENNSDLFISDSIFPIVSGFDKSTKEYNLYMPFQWGGDRLMKTPFKKLGDGNHVHWNRENNKIFARYPLTLVTAWVDYSDAQGGLGFDLRNATKDIFDFGCERMILKDQSWPEQNREALWMAFAFYPSLNKGEVWNSCEFILRPHRGDWHTVADAHRIWLEDNVRVPIIPQNFAESLGWHFYHMKHQDGTVVKTYEDLPKMAAASQAAGIDNIMVFGWQQGGHDNAYPFGYYTNKDWGGTERLRELLAEVQANGCRVIPFYNGTLLDQATPEFKKFGYKWAVLGRTGSWYDGYDYSRCNFDIPFGLTARGTTSRNMHLCDLCFPAQEPRAFVLETVRRITEAYGFKNIQLDQLAHKSYVCYDPAHGHEKPQWAFTKELESLMVKMRAQIRANDPEAVIVGEGFSDLTTQYCDAHWNWNQITFPEIVRYSVPWMLFSHETDALEYKAVNICFANKILLDLKIEGGDAYVTEYPEFTQHLARLAALKKKLPDTYLAGLYRDEDGIGYDRETGLLAKVYLNREKNRLGIIAANLEHKDISASIKLEHKPQGTITVHEYAGGKSELKLKGATLDVALKPYEVRVFEMHA